MINSNSIISPIKTNLLVAFADITNFAKYSKKIDSLELFNFINEFAEITGEIIENAGGKVIKFIGDCALVIFPENKVSRGIEALEYYKEKVDSWLKKKGLTSNLIIKAHFGEVTYGPLGLRDNKYFDVMGETVNIAASIQSNGLAITPQVFRKLDKNTRTLFKKHTPPITYIDIREKHKD